MKTVLLLLGCLISFCAQSQQNEEVEIGKTIEKMMHYLSFTNADSLQLDSLNTVFVSEGKLTANFGEQPMYFTVPQYVDAVRKNIRTNNLVSSEEKELARKVDVFGSIAHVLSTYQLTITKQQGTTVRKGINSIQLIKQDGNWLILSLLWDRESDTLKLPSKYLVQ